MKRPFAVAAIALIWGIILADVNNYHSWGLRLYISLIVYFDLQAFKGGCLFFVFLLFHS